MGGGLVAAVLTPILGKSERMTYGGPDPDGNINDAINGVSTTTHYLPVKAGLSASFALSDRLNVTTGLEYSLYLSRFKSLSETEWQQAHYIGIPVRLDYTLLSYKGLDLYLGGGMEADYCLAALRAGEGIEKDGWSFSVLGASGIQYHFTVADSAVMREAQKHPEDYQDLIVRIAGYSAYFTHMSVADQNDYIQRFEHQV